MRHSISRIPSRRQRGGANGFSGSRNAVLRKAVILKSGNRCFRRSVKSRGVPLHKMPVGVQEVDLRVAGGRVGFDDDFLRVIIGQIFVKTSGVQLFECAAETFDTEGNVSFVDVHGRSRPPARIGHPNDVKLLAVRELEPCTRKRKVRALQFRESKKTAIKSSRLFDVADGDLQVMKGCCGHGRRYSGLKAENPFAIHFDQ
jgi:hypothetical protein